MTELVQFQLSDVPRMLPELLLLFLAMLVLGSDVFTRWGSDPEAQRERSRESGSLTALGLGLIFFISLLQSGYVYQLPAGFTTDNWFSGFFANIVRNMQYGVERGSSIAVPVQELSPLLGAFATDDVTMVARLLFIGAAFLTVLLTMDVLPESNPGEFYSLIIASTLGMCLMAASNELILAFLAVELTSIPLYILAGYFVGGKQPSEGGMKYFLFGALSSCLLLYGMSLVYGYAALTASAANVNTANDLTQFARIAELASVEGTTSSLLMLGVVFMISGLGYKVAVVPFHSWSPDVYQAAPTPITAFISTASKAAGFFLLFRVTVSAFPGLAGSASFADATDFSGWSGVLAIVAVLTLIAGNLMALPQVNAKRLLAYSSIAHAGFIIMGLMAWASPVSLDHSLGTSSLLYYLVAYTLTNIGAFGTLAVISLAVGSDNLQDLNGLAQRNLGLALLMAVFVLSLAGIPPLSGFFAKFFIFMAGWQSGAIWLVIVGVVTTVISLYYYLGMLKAMFITAPETREPIPVPTYIHATLIIAAVLVIALGVYPNMIMTVLDSAAETVASL